jgi:hypothetical protein
MSNAQLRLSGHLGWLLLIGLCHGLAFGLLIR